MSAPIDLVTALGGLQLASLRNSTGSKHIVSFTFPAVDLLPQGSRIVLSPPADLGRREHPDVSSDYSKALRPAFFAKLDVWGADPFSFATPLGGAGKALRDAIEDLRRTAGSSSLRMVSYRTETNAVSHLFRLITYLELDSPAQDFLLEDQDWYSLVNLTSVYPWLAILNDLVSRASDYAFIAVYKTLAVLAGSADANLEMVLHHARWATELPRPLPELFLARLTPVTNHDAAFLEKKADNSVNLILPCGHQIDIQASKISVFSEEELRTNMCPECRSRILQATDDEEASRYVALDTIRTWKQSNASWTVHEGEPVDNAAQLYCNCANLIEALTKALSSLDMPAPAVCPAALNPVNFPETVAVMERHEKIKATLVRDRPLSIGANDLLQMMTNFANAAMQSDPSLVSDLPEYSSFLSLWLNRAISSMNLGLAIQSVEIRIDGSQEK